MIRHKSKWAKGEMARTIVIYCIKILTCVLVWAILLTTAAACFQFVVDLSPILNFTAVTFGGELVLLAFKRVFARKDEEVN